MRRYLAGCLVILAGSSLVLLLVLLLFRDQIEAVTDVPGPWLTVAALTSVAQFLILLRLILWQVRQQAWRYAGFQFAQSLLNALLSLVLVITAGWAWEGRVAAQAIVAGAFGVLALALLVRARAFLWPARREDVRSALAFGVPLIPHVIGALLISALDRVMISNMLDVAQAGIYTVALQIGMVLGLLTESFNRAYAPWLTEALAANDRARDIRIVRGTYSYFVCVSAIAILVGLAAPPLLEVLVGAQFRAAAPAVIYIAMGYAFGGMYYMVTNYVFYAGYTGRLAWLTLGSGVFNAAATYVLIRENGAVGAAQAFMLSQAALFFGTWALAHRARPMPWRQALVRSQAACSSRAI